MVLEFDPKLYGKHTAWLAKTLTTMAEQLQSPILSRGEWLEMYEFYRCSLGDSLQQLDDSSLSAVNFCAHTIPLLLPYLEMCDKLCTDLMDHFYGRRPCCSKIWAMKTVAQILVLRQRVQAAWLLDVAEGAKKLGGIRAGAGAGAGKRLDKGVSKGVGKGKGVEQKPS